MRSIYHDERIRDVRNVLLRDNEKGNLKLQIDNYFVAEHIGDPHYN